MQEPSTDVARELLLQQFDIACRFADDFIIGRVDERAALWEPSKNVCTVHRTAEGWRSDWPQEVPPIPDVTIGWLLWHIEWWWSDAIQRVRERTPLDPMSHQWSGGTERLSDLQADWLAILRREPLDRRIPWLTADARPFWSLAAWLNFELTKNLAEINQLQRQRRNRILAEH